MPLKDVMATLKKLGKPSAAKTYQRHGAKDECYGVSFADLGKLTKKLKGDHQLAWDLWGTKISEARILGLMIADPVKLTAEQADAFVKDVHNRGYTYYLACLVSRSPLASSKMKEWMKSDDEHVRSAGYNIVGVLAKDAPDSLSDAEGKKLLATIEKEIHGSANWARYAMNMALIGVGINKPGLRKQVLEVAKRIGKVDVDVGDTSCQVPDAASYIAKAAKRSR